MFFYNDQRKYHLLKVSITTSTGLYILSEIESLTSKIENIFNSFDIDFPLLETLFWLFYYDQIFYPIYKQYLRVKIDFHFSLFLRVSNISYKIYISFDYLKGEKIQIKDFGFFDFFRFLSFSLILCFRNNYTDNLKILEKELSYRFIWSCQIIHIIGMW